LFFSSLFFLPLLSKKKNIDAAPIPPSSGEDSDYRRAKYWVTVVNTVWAHLTDPNNIIIEVGKKIVDFESKGYMLPIG
jgi:hypothetical protein